MFIFSEIINACVANYLVVLKDQFKKMYIVQTIF